MAVGTGKFSNGDRRFYQFQIRNSNSDFKIHYVLLSILQVLVGRIRALLHDIFLNCQRFQKYHHFQEESARRKQLGRKKIPNESSN